MRGHLTAIGVSLPYIKTSERHPSILNFSAIEDLETFDYSRLRRNFASGEFGTWTFLAIGIEDGPTDEDDLYGVPYRELVNITPETCSPSDEFPWDIFDPDQFSLDCPQGMGALAMDDDMEYNANGNIQTISSNAVSESGSKPGSGYYMTTGQDTDNPALSESLLKKASREEMLKSQKVRFLYRIR